MLCLLTNTPWPSEGTPAQGALEDHHDRPPGSPPEEVEQLNSSCHRSRHLLADGSSERELAMDAIATTACFVAGKISMHKIAASDDFSLY